MKKKILDILKTKAASFGFNTSELESAADAIASNFQNEEDATDENINARIEAVMPLLKLSQQSANRVINKQKEDSAKQLATLQAELDAIKKQHNEPNDDKDKDAPAWFKTYQTQMEQAQQRMQAQFDALNAEKIAANRKEQMNNLLKETGSYGTSIMKAFARMAFKDDAEFNTYLDETKAEVENYKKEMSEKGLVITPPSVTDPTPKTATDEELKALVATM